MATWGPDSLKFSVCHPCTLYSNKRLEGLRNREASTETISHARNRPRSNTSFHRRPLLFRNKLSAVIYSTHSTHKFSLSKKNPHIKISRPHFQNFSQQPGNTESFHLILLQLPQFVWWLKTCSQT